MKILDTSLLVFDIASIAFGYRALNELTGAGALRILEATPLGARFMILAQGEPSVLKVGSEKIRALVDGGDPAVIADTELIENLDPRVSEALYSLSEAQLEKGLVIVECDSVSGCLSSAQTLVKGHGLRAIEIKVQRSSTAGAYGLFTGSAHACMAGAEDVRSRLKAAIRQGRIEVVTNPSLEFKRYFQLSGET
jgi:hypothetical protein